MSSQGTRPFEMRSSSAISASGMRLRKLKLTAPITALKAKIAANCDERGLPARQAAATMNVTKLPEFCTAASRDKYFPRKVTGTNSVIQGSHAQLEMPRDKLKQNNSTSISASRLLA